MTAREKLLRIRPDAICQKHSGYTIVTSISNELIAASGLITLSNHQPRESWAWAEAYRNLTKGK